MHSRKTPVRKDSRLFAEICSALLRRGHGVRFRVEGDSMRPNLLSGDEVVVVPVNLGDVRRGEVALTQNADGLLVHRITSVDRFDGSVETRGDAGLEGDPVSRSIFGKVITRHHGERGEYFGMLRTRVLHPLRTFVERARHAVARRLHCAVTFVFRIVVLLLFCRASFASVGIAVVAFSDCTKVVGKATSAGTSGGSKVELDFTGVGNAANDARSLINTTFLLGKELSFQMDCSL